MEYEYPSSLVRYILKVSEEMSSSSAAQRPFWDMNDERAIVADATN